MSEASNNMSPQRGDNKIVTQIRIINQQMDWLTNKFGDKLERKYVNNHGRVQIRSERREFNARRDVRRVDTNMDEFMVNSVNISDVDFEDVFVGHWEPFGQ